MRRTMTNKQSVCSPFVLSVCSGRYACRCVSSVITGRAQAQRNLERKTRLTQDEQLELRGCCDGMRRVSSHYVRRFDATAEAVDGCGRRRLWVEYRRGGAASEGPARGGGGTT